jgi:hypothetical protein
VDQGPVNVEKDSLYHSVTNRNGSG